MEKRFSLKITLFDNVKKEQTEYNFTANRKIGAWKKVLEEVLRHITLAQLMTFLGKRKDIGFGWADIMGWICWGKNDDTLLKEN